MKTLAPVLLTLGLAGSALVLAQDEGGAQQAPAKPAPRWPDGRISFTGTPNDVGNWEGPANGTIFFNVDSKTGKKVTPPSSLPSNLDVDKVPFQQWARDQYMKRESQAEDPHT